MAEGCIRIQIGNYGTRTSIQLDGEPLWLRRLTVVAAASERTQVLLDPPQQFGWPIFVEVMDASSVIGTPVGDYVLVSQPLFRQMEAAWRREQAYRREGR